MNNFVMLKGNLGRDPEAHKFENGNIAVRFSLATNERYKDKDGEFQTITTWHLVKCWGKVADKAFERLKKGARVLVEGKLRVDTWGEGEDRRSAVFVYARSIELIDVGEKESGWAEAPDDHRGPSDDKDEAPPNLDGVPGMEADDDLPF